MPLMTAPLAHFEMLLEDTKQLIANAEHERMSAEIRLQVLNETRYRIANALDAERDKIKAA